MTDRPPSPTSIQISSDDAYDLIYRRKSTQRTQTGPRFSFALFALFRGPSNSPSKHKGHRHPRGRIPNQPKHPAKATSSHPTSTHIFSLLSSRLRSSLLSLSLKPDPRTLVFRSFFGSKMTQNQALSTVLLRIYLVHRSHCKLIPLP